MTAACAVLLAAFTAGTAQAVTYAWDGGSTVDSNWSTGENWNPDGAPVSAANTLIQFNGTTRLTPAQDIGTPFVLNRLEFLGGATYTTAFAIGSNQLQFVANGATQPVVYLNRNATCRINNDIDVPAGTTLNLTIGTYGVELYGLITGEGALDKSSASGGISLHHADNTFSGGLTIRAGNNNWAKFNVYASGAMGTGPVSLYGGPLGTGLTSPGGLNFYGTTTHTNLISLYANSPIFSAMPNGTATVTLDGDLDLNSYTLYLRGGGVGTVNGVLSEGGASAVTKVDAGTWTLAGANTFTGRLTINNGTLKLGAAGTLDSQAGVSVSCATGWYSVASATLDLNGHDQTVSELSGSQTLPTLANILTSAAAATLTVHQDTATEFNGLLTGALSLVKDGAGTLTLSNNLSTTTGDVTVSNGTLVVAAGASLGNGANVTVAGGSLELYAAAALSDAASLSIADSGAKVLLAAGSTETVDKLFLNGVQQPRGYYGATASGAQYIDDAHFDGTGQLYVTSNPPITPADVTWDAEGADTLVSTALNWVGEAVPAFDGATHAVFATGGMTATVDTAVSTYGLTFNRDGAFTLEAGDGVITNGVGGIQASAPSTTSRTYTLAEDVILGDNQTWAVTTNWPGATTLNVTGTLDDGFLPCAITKAEFGPLNLSGDNTFDGAVIVSNGILRISHANALGSTNGATTVYGVAGGLLYLNGSAMEISEPLVLDGERNNGGTFRNESGSNTLSGPITCLKQVRLQVYGNALVIDGGVTAGDAGTELFVINTSSVLYFRSKPLLLGSKQFYSDSGGLTVLGVSGNLWADTLTASGTLRCDVPDALPPSASLRLGIGTYGPNGTLNLNGNDQTCSRLYIGSTLPGTRTITSPTPATLTVNQSANTIFDARFTGAVSLLKLGAGNLTLTNAATSTAGSFVVSNGTLAVASDGTFGNNSTNIVVGGTGTLALSNAVAIADSATVTMPEAGVSTAKISLAAGVNEKVGWLFYGGKMQRVGTYGATGSPATHKDDTHFSGLGVLEVLRDNSGTMILLL
jgi:autotransporter-associated beta strand protein